MNWSDYGYPEVNRQSIWLSLAGLKEAVIEIGIFPNINNIDLPPMGARYGRKGPYGYNPDITDYGTFTGYLFEWMRIFDRVISINENGNISYGIIREALDALGETIISIDSIRGTQQVVPYLQQRYRILKYLLEKLIRK